MNPVWMVSEFDDEAHSAHYRVARDAHERDRFLREAQIAGHRSTLEILDLSHSMAGVAWSVVA